MSDAVARSREDMLTEHEAAPARAIEFNGFLHSLTLTGENCYDPFKTLPYRRLINCPTVSEVLAANKKKKLAAAAAAAAATASETRMVDDDDDDEEDEDGATAPAAAPPRPRKVIRARSKSTAASLASTSSGGTGRSGLGGSSLQQQVHATGGEFQWRGGAGGSRAPSPLLDFSNLDALYPAIIGSSERRGSRSASPSVFDNTAMQSTLLEREATARERAAKAEASAAMMERMIQLQANHNQQMVSVMQGQVSDQRDLRERQRQDDAQSQAALMEF